MAKYKRNLKNFLLEPGFQLKFCAIVIGTALLFSLLIASYFYVGMKEAVTTLMDIFESFDVPPEQVEGYLSDQIRPIIQTILGMLLAYFIIVSILVVVETHKVVGAKYAIKRFVKDSLRTFSFSDRIYLRKKDYFRDVEKELNELAESLEQKYNKAEPPVQNEG